MEQTKMFFPERTSLPGRPEPEITETETAWHKTVDAYHDLDFEKQIAWRDGVTRKYPRLDRLVAEIVQHAQSGARQSARGSKAN